MSPRSHLPPSLGAAAGRLALALAGALALTFLLLPLVSVFFELSPAQLVSKLTSGVAYQALLLSVQTAFIAVIVTIIFGTPIAWWLAKTEFRGKRFVDTALQMPIVTPPAVAGVGLLLVFGRAGLLGETFGVFGVEIPFTVTAVVLAQTFIAAPFYITASRQAFDAVDDELLAVSRTLGVGPWRTFWRTVVPLALPGMLTGASLTLARALGEFGATLVFAGNLQGKTQTLPLAIFTSLQSDADVAVAISALLLLVAFLLLLFVSALNRRAQLLL